MTRGEALRKEITAEYTFEGAVAKAMLDSICREADLIEEMEQAVAREGVTIDGARGQKVANPVLAPLARHQALLNKLLAEAFPGESESTSEKAARAARTRWQRAGVRK